jgi:hypothetical protein
MTGFLPVLGKFSPRLYEIKAFITYQFIEIRSAMMRSVLALIVAVFLVNHAAAGTWTSNNFVYKPSLGARGQGEKDAFDSGMDRVDAHLGKYKTLGDPGHATLSEALTTIGSVNATLVIPAGTANISSNTTIPANVHLMVLRGGQFNIANGVTLTINGPFEAGLHQVFTWTGTGKAAFGPGAVEKVFCEWWGGKGDDSTNNAAALQAAVNAHHRVRLPRGTYRVNNATIYLNSSDQSHTYILEGSGVHNSILKPVNFTSGYLFKLNEDAGGNRLVEWPIQPRAIFRDFRVDASGSTSVSLLRPNRAPFQFHNLYLDYLLYGANATGYTDSVTMHYVRSENWRSGGYLYQTDMNNDGASFNQIFGGRIRLYKSGGASIRNTIGCSLILDSCIAASVEGCHYEEGTEHDVVTANIQLIDSQATLRNNHISVYRDVYPVYIKDSSTAYPQTYVILDGNKFHFYPLASNTTVRAVWINQLGNGSVVVFRDNVMNHIYTGGWAFHSPTGIAVGSDDSAINTLVTANDKKGLLGGQVALSTYNGAWRLAPAHDVQRVKYGANPGIYTTEPLNTSNGSLTAATYYYKCAFYNGTAWSAASSEASAVVGSGQNAVILHTECNNTFGVLRVWRGTSSGSYNRYVDIPIGQRGRSQLIDWGNMLGGFAWVTSGVPTPPTTNNTMDGYVMDNGKRVFYAAAAPTSSEFTAVLGDIIWKTSPTAASTPGWVCTTAGSPGTWKAMANLAG